MNPISDDAGNTPLSQQTYLNNVALSFRLNYVDHSALLNFRFGDYKKDKLLKAAPGKDVLSTIKDYSKAEAAQLFGMSETEFSVGLTKSRLHNILNNSSRFASTHGKGQQSDHLFNELFNAQFETDAEFVTWLAQSSFYATFFISQPVGQVAEELAVHVASQQFKEIWDSWRLFLATVPVNTPA